MRFEIGAKASVPEDADSVLFFELRSRGKNAKDSPPKYWTCVNVPGLDPGRLQLQIYKAPVEYAAVRQRRVPKQNCFLHLTIH
eukprot:3106801-Rhodomonas_salina.2